MSIRLKCILLMLLPVVCGLVSIVAAMFNLNQLETEYVILKRSTSRLLTFLVFEEHLSQLFSILSSTKRPSDAACQKVIIDLRAGLKRVHDDLPLALRENPRLALHAEEMDSLSDTFLKLIGKAEGYLHHPDDATLNSLKLGFFSLGLTARSMFGETEEAEDWLQNNSLANLKRQEQLVLPFLLISNLITLAATAIAITIFNRQIIAPLQKLKNHIKTGELTIKSDQPRLLRKEKKGDEIVRLDQAITSAFEDISALNQAELAIVQYSGDVLCSLNGNGIITSINKSCETFWGYPAESLIGVSLESIVAEQSLAAMLKMLNKAKIEGGVRSVECQHIDISGIDTYFLWTIHWVEEEQEFLCVCHDITQKHQLQSLRENICATLSHDMRTPLMSMSTSIELLVMKSDNASPRKTGLLKDSSQLAQKLIKLVTDVLDWKKIESGNLGIIEEQIDARSLAEEVAEKIESLYQAISVDLVNEGKGQVSGDHDLLLRSLVSAFEILVTRVVRSQPLTMIVRNNMTANNTKLLRTISFIAFLPEATDDGDFSKAAPEQLINSDSIMTLNLPMSFYLVDNIIRNHGGTIGVILDNGFIQQATVTLPLDLKERN